MYDYSNQIKAFHAEKVTLSQVFREKLYAHRKATRDRIIDRLPKSISGLTVTVSSFSPQGSMAMGTIIQTRFKEEEYDIDDGLVLKRSQLINKDGQELSAEKMKEILREACKDNRFKKQPRISKNAVRVFYADEDEEKHHIDIPTYRIFKDDQGREIQEIAGETGWNPSNPTQVNKWFADRIIDLNKAEEGKGTQLRILVQLCKRFARSRRDWDLPNGMNLTMLVNECQPDFERLDVAFYSLLEKLNTRLQITKAIYNLAHPDLPMLTHTFWDAKVVSLQAKIATALDDLKILKAYDCDRENARSAWDLVFQSDGFFKDYDDTHFSNGGNNTNGIASSTPRLPFNRSNHGGQYAS